MPICKGVRYYIVVHWLKFAELNNACPFFDIEIRHDDIKGFTEHFELVICKQRICHGYTDLIDPEKLKKLLQQQEEVNLITTSISIIIIM